MRLLIIATVVLTVFMLIAAADTSGTVFGSGPTVWLAAALLAFFVDVLIGHKVDEVVGRRRGPPAR